MMNRDVLQNSPVQQMMASGNPSWWPNINNLMRPPILSSHQQPFLSSFHSNSINDNNSSSFLQANTMNNMAIASSSSWLDDHPNPWSQLLLGGVLLGEGKKMDDNNWEEQVVLRQQQETPHHYPHDLVDVKQESSSVNNYISNNNNNNNVYDQEFQLAAAKVANWSHHHQLSNNIPVSSPQSCVTSFSSSNNLVDFSSSISSDNLHSRKPTPAPDHTSECNSTATGGAAKKAKIIQPSSTQSNTPTLKVRKEKLGDRITALHQLVSPFGKTDTASVLLEAIGYIRFLQSQIEALSIPYLNNGAANKKQPHPVIPTQGERKCIFPEDPGQLLNDNSLKRKGGPDQDSSYEEPKDLRSKGLCLVPVSCTLHVGSDNGADYWAPTLDGGFQ